MTIKNKLENLNIPNFIVNEKRGKVFKEIKFEGVLDYLEVEAFPETETCEKLNFYFSGVFGKH